MKYHVFLFLFSLLILGCSSDDSNSGNDSATGNYFPSSLDDSWTYAVENTSTSNPQLNFNETDVVTVNSVTDNSFTIEVNDGTTPANGTMNSFFGSGTFTKSNTALKYNGDLPLLSDIDVLPISDLTLTDFTLYDVDATSNAQLYSDSDSFTQDINLGGQNIPVTTTYQITNTNISNLSSLTVNDAVYTNVLHTEIKLNLAISTVIDVGISITQSIIDAQDVLVINNYYAENVGLIKSDANQSVAISPAFILLLETAGLNVEFPTDTSVDNTQELESYTLSSN